MQAAFLLQPVTTSSGGCLLTLRPGVCDEFVQDAAACVLPFSVSLHSNTGPEVVNITGDIHQRLLGLYPLSRTQLELI